MEDLMVRLGTCIVVLTLLVSQTALAEEGQGSDFAQYSVSTSVSPFGGTLGFGYNSSAKTSWQFALGGMPSAVAPEMKVDISGTEYTVNGNSSWVGCFLNHRPIETAKWFRLVAGLGIGSIENEVKDGAGNSFQLDYNDNPVGYLGLGFGLEPVKGFVFGFDLGILSTAGPMASQTEVKADGKALEAIKDHFFFGNVLPNAQLTLGWGF